MIEIKILFSVCYRRHPPLNNIHAFNTHTTPPTVRVHKRVLGEDV